MSNFTFNENDSPERNLERFLDFLAQSDPEMARIFRDNLHLIHPVPDNSTAKGTARKLFTEQVLSALQKIQEAKPTS